MMTNTLLRPCNTSSARPFQGARLRCPGARRPLAVRALFDDGGAAAAPYLVALPLVAAVGVAAWKVSMYGQIEVITAKMLTNCVPRESGGTRVIQLQGGTRELFYYPKTTVQVTVVGEELNQQLLEQAGEQAAVPTLVKKQSPVNLGFAADNSVDAVVSLGAMAGMNETQRASFASEALRVLKPGCPIVFIEKIPGGSPLRYIGGSDKMLSESYLRGWQQRTDAFELVRWDVALEGQDPYAAGVAVKSATYRAQAPSRRVEKEAERAAERVADKEARREKTKLPKKGFV